MAKATAIEKMKREKEKQLKKKLVLKEYIDVCLEKGHLVSRADYRMATEKSHGLAESLFGKWNELKEAALQDPRVKNNLFTPEDFSDQAWNNTAKKIMKSEQLFITFAEAGASVRSEALSTLRHMAKAMKAEIGIIPNGPDLLQLSKEFKGMNILFRNLAYNSNLNILGNVMMNKSSIRPQSGLGRLGNRSCSVIYGAPKLSKEPVATAPERLPHLLYTTGAITNANYRKYAHLMPKASYVAEQDHDISALYVEREGDLYWVRPVQFDVDGSAVMADHTGVRRFYPNGKVKAERPLDFNVGDWHSSETSKITYHVWPAIAKLTQPHRIGIHDIFSYLSNSHHTHGNALVEALIAENGESDPQLQFEILARDLQMWKEATKGFLCEKYVVKSNHDEHLDQAIEYDYLNRPETRRLYLDVSLAMMDHKDPLVYCLQKYTKFDFKGFRFLKRGERYGYSTTAGEYLNLSDHGDQMGNGLKGSSKSGPTGKMVQNIGCSNVGHAHACSIHAGNTRNGYGSGSVWTNGTSTCITGPGVPKYAASNNSSDWLQTSTLSFGQLNSQGLVTGRITRTQVTIIDGRWCRGAEAVGGKLDVRQWQDMKRLYYRYKLDGKVSA